MHSHLVQNFSEWRLITNQLLRIRAKKHLNKYQNRLKYLALIRSKTSKRQGIIQYRCLAARSLPSNPHVDHVLNRFEAHRLHPRVKIATAALLEWAT